MSIEGIPAGFVQYLEGQGVPEAVQAKILGDRAAPALLAAVARDSGVLEPWLRDLFTENGKLDEEALKVVPIIQGFFAERATVGDVYGTEQTGAQNASIDSGVDGSPLGGEEPLDPPKLWTPINVPGVPELSTRFHPDFIDIHGEARVSEPLAQAEESAMALDDDEYERFLEDLVLKRPKQFKAAGESAHPLPQDAAVDQLVTRIKQDVEVAMGELKSVEALRDGYAGALKQRRATGGDLLPRVYYEETILPALQTWVGALRQALADFKALERYEKTGGQEFELSEQWEEYEAQCTDLADLGGLDPSGGPLLKALEKTHRQRGSGRFRPPAQE